MRTFAGQTTFAIGLAAVLLALTGCGPSMRQLTQLAGTGEINQTAPVSVHVEMKMAAPPARVWALLVNAPAWPSWNRDIAKVSVTQPLALGTRFVWGEGSNIIHSQVQLFEPEHRLGWTGTAYTAKAVHQWELISEPGGGTLVKMSESMDGPLMATLFSSQKLAEAGTAWLVQLKQAAEQPQDLPTR